MSEKNLSYLEPKSHRISSREIINSKGEIRNRIRDLLNFDLLAFHHEELEQKFKALEPNPQLIDLIREYIIETKKLEAEEVETSSDTIRELAKQERKFFEKLISGKKGTQETESDKLRLSSKDLDKYRTPEKEIIRIPKKPESAESIEIKKMLVSDKNKASNLIVEIERITGAAPLVHRKEVFKRKLQGANVDKSDVVNRLREIGMLYRKMAHYSKDEEAERREEIITELIKSLGNDVE